MGRPWDQALPPAPAVSRRAGACLTSDSRRNRSPAPSTGIPAWFLDWVAIEREAVTLHTWQSALIPGLLQTPEYARAILASWRLDTDGGIGPGYSFPAPSGQEMWKHHITPTVR
jgi:hypothetical protein